MRRCVSLLTTSAFSWARLRLSHLQSSPQVTLSLCVSLFCTLSSSSSSDSEGLLELLLESAPFFLLRFVPFAFGLALAVGDFLL